MEATRRFARTAALASFLGTAVAGGVAFDAAVATEAAAYEVDESYFYGALAPHGRWVSSAEFGWVWYPSHRPRGWRPYTVGRWEWTDYGEWLWVSDEPWGWATYHYGRWYLDPFFGWVWLPGRIWAPAWVSWRYADDYIGWSPLGPWGYWDWRYRRYRDWDRWHHHHHGHHGRHDRHDRGDWDRDRRDRDHDRVRVETQERDSWVFTRKRDFTSPRVDRVALDSRRASDVMQRSRAVEPPSEQDERQGRGVSRGIDKREIERATGRPVRTVKVEERSAPPSRGGAVRKGDRVEVFKPRVSEAKPGSPTPDRLPGSRGSQGGVRSDDRSRSPGDVRGTTRPGGSREDDRRGEPGGIGNRDSDPRGGGRVERPTEPGSDRPMDRGSDRQMDRGSDRQMDRGSDRQMDRGGERSIERGGPSRGGTAAPRDDRGPASRPHGGVGGPPPGASAPRDMGAPSRGPSRGDAGDGPSRGPDRGASPTMGGPSMGGPSMGGPSMGGPSMGGGSMGGGSMGGSSHGGGMGGGGGGGGGGRGR